MEREIKINLSLEDKQYNIQESIDKFLESIDFEKDKESDFVSEKINIIFIENEKDITSDWRERESYKMIKDTIAKIIKMQFIYHNNFKEAFKKFQNTLNEIIKK